MKIFVTVKPRAKENAVAKIDGTHFVVSVTEPPIEGRANRAILEMVATHFDVSPSRVMIVSGHTSRQKAIEIT